MANSCAVNVASAEASATLSSRLQQIINVDDNNQNEGKANVAITPDVANKLISESIQKGYINEADIENVDDVKLLNAALSVIRDNHIAKGGSSLPSLGVVVSSALVAYGRKWMTDKSLANYDADLYVEGKNSNIIGQDVIDTPKPAQYEEVSKDHNAPKGRLIDVFNGDGLRMSGFCKSFASFVFESAREDVLEEAINDVEHEINKFRRNLAKGLDEKGIPASKRKIASMRNDIAKKERKLNSLKTDGWVALASMGDYMAKSFDNVLNELKSAYIVCGEAKRLKKEGFKGNINDIIEKAIEVAQVQAGKGSITRNLIIANLRKPFLHNLFLGYDKNTSEEELAYRKKNAKSTDDENVLEYEQYLKEKKDEVEANDKDILSNRKKSDAAMDELYRRVCNYMGEVSNVDFSLGIKSKKSDEEKNDEDNSETENDAEYEENVGRDIQFTKAYERSVAASIGAGVKKTLATMFMYKYDSENDEFVVSRYDEFNGAVSLPINYTFNFLLELQSEQNGGRGFKNGHELYEYLAAHEKETTWFHGIVMAMEKDVSLMTSFFVSLNKVKMPMRSASEINRSSKSLSDDFTNTGLYSMSENDIKEGVSAVQQAILTRTTSGVVLESGKVGTFQKKIKYEQFLRKYVFSGVSQRKDLPQKGLNKNIDYELIISDISLYDEYGKPNPGKITLEGITSEECDNELVEPEQKQGVKVHLSGGLGYEALFEIVDAAIKNRDGSYVSFQDIAKFMPEYANNIIRMLKAVGFECSIDSLKSEFSRDEAAFTKMVTVLGNFGSIQNEDSAFFNRAKRSILGLAESIPNLKSNNIEPSYMFGGKTRYSYMNKNFVNEITAELGDNEDDAKVTEYIKSNFIGDNNGDSIFAEWDDGKHKLLNGILADVMPGYKKPSSIKRNPGFKWDVSDWYRRSIKLGTHGNIGMKTRSGSTIEVDDMPIADMVRLEIENFFNPKTIFNRPLSKELSNGKGESHTFPEKFKSQAQYSLGTFADSGNHIFTTARRHPAGKTWSVGEGWKYSYLQSYEEDGLLDRVANVVISEVDRMNAFSRNSIDGKKLDRVELPKTFKKNAMKFCNFPGMNKIEVRIGETGDIISLFDAVNKLRTEDVSPDAKIYWHKKGFDFIHIPQDASRPQVSMLLMDIVRSEIMDSTWRGLRKLRDEGVFNRLQEISSYGFVERIELEYMHDLLLSAKNKDGENSLALSNILGQDSEFVKNSGKIGIVDALGLVCGPLYCLDLYFMSETRRNNVIKDCFEAFGRLGNYVNTIASDDKTMETDNYASALVKSFLDVSNSLNKEAVAETERFADGTELKVPKSRYVLPVWDKGIPYEIFRNEAVEKAIEFALNKTAFHTQMNQILVGDLAQFKGIEDYSKRLKGAVSASERCDLSALDKRNGNRKCIEYYGERKINDEIPGWDVRYQRSITLRDMETKVTSEETVEITDANGVRREVKVPKNGGFANFSKFFNEKLQPRLVENLKAGIITPQEFAETCSAYTAMNTSDGQTFRTLESMKKMFDMLGLSTEGTERIYKAIVVEKRKLRIDEIQDTIKQLKSVAYDFQDISIPFVEEDPYTHEKVVRNYNMRMVDFIKDSEFTLMMYTDEYSEYLGEDSMLRGVMEFASDHMVDLIHFESTKKTGETNIVDLTDCADRKSAYDKLSAFDEAGKKDLLKSIYHKESWERVGRQIPSTDHLVDKKQGIGTQIDKLISVDMTDTWEHVERDEEGNVIVGSDGNPIKSESEVSVAVRDADGNVTARLDRNAFKSRIDAIKVINMREDLRTLEEMFGDKNKLSEMLLRSVETTNRYPDCIMDALRINPETGDFNIPLDNPVITPVVTSVISSFVRNNIIKQKTTGGTAIQFSSVGRTDALKVETGIDEVTHQPYIKYVEAMLPAWSKKLFEAFADEYGNIDIDNVPPELRTMVGYRVPTEHLYSAVPIRIVGFLPSEGGTSIMLPQEIVTWSGSDFDIDKLFLEIPCFSVNQERLNVKRSEAEAAFYEANPALFDAICAEWNKEIAKDLANPNVGEEQKQELQSIIEDPIGNADAFSRYRKGWARLLNDDRKSGGFTDVLNSDMQVKVFNAFNKFAKDRGFVDPITVDTHSSLNADCSFEELANASREDRDNLLVRLHYARLTSDFSFMDVVRPGGFTTQKKMARAIVIMKNDKSRSYNIDELMSMSLDDLNKMADNYKPSLGINDFYASYETFERNRVGGKMIGIYALHNAYHAVMQWSPTHISEAGEFYKRYFFAINGKPMRTELGSIKDEDGNSITLNIAGFLLASVDNAKDPILSDLGQNPVTADLTLALLHMGYSIQTATLIMTQPIVKLFLDDIGARSSFKVYCFFERKGVPKFSPDVAVNKQSLCEHIGDEFRSFDSAMNDPFQLNILSILGTTSKIAKCIGTSMNALKITSAKDNLANNLGETVKRMSPVDELNEVNTSIIKNKEGDITVNVFDPIEFNRLVVKSDDKSGGIGSWRDRKDDVSLYFKKDDTDKYSGCRLPAVQAAYDFGFVNSFAMFDGVMSSYGEKIINAIRMLNSFNPSSNGVMMLSEDVINMFVREYKMYLAMSAFADSDKFESPQQMRKVYLTSFPEYYVKELQRIKNNTQRDLISEFEILGNLRRVEKRTQDGGKYSVLLFGAGRINNELRNTFVNSWDLMAKDKDADVRSLAFQLYKYSILQNGGVNDKLGFGGYAPPSVMARFGEYNKAISDMGKQDVPMRFIDQFIRNNYQSLGSVIGRINAVGQTNLKLDEIGVAFRAKSYSYKEDYSGNLVFTQNTSLFPNDYIVVTDNNAKYFNDANYFEVTLNDITYLYRKREFDVPNSGYVRVDTLGKYDMKEYDPSSDIGAVSMEGSSFFSDSVFSDFVSDVNSGKVKPSKKNSGKVKSKYDKSKERSILFLGSFQQSAPLSSQHPTQQTQQPVAIQTTQQSTQQSTQQIVQQPAQQQTQQPTQSTSTSKLLSDFEKIKANVTYNKGSIVSAGNVKVEDAKDYVKELLGYSKGDERVRGMLNYVKVKLFDNTSGDKYVSFKAIEDPEDWYIFSASITGAKENLKNALSPDQSGNFVHDIPIVANVNTRLGKRVLGDTIDMVVEHNDGSISIGLIDVFVGKSHPKVSNARINTVRSLIKSRHNDVVIRDMVSLPIVLTIGTKTKEGYDEGKIIPDFNAGETLIVDVDYSSMKITNVSEDPTASGISDPSPIEGSTQTATTTTQTKEQTLLEVRNEFVRSVLNGKSVTDAFGTMTQSSNENVRTFMRNQVFVSGMADALHELLDVNVLGSTQNTILKSIVLQSLIEATRTATSEEELLSTAKRSLIEASSSKESLAAYVNNRRMLSDGIDPDDMLDNIPYRDETGKAVPSNISELELVSSIGVKMLDVAAGMVHEKYDMMDAPTSAAEISKEEIEWNKKIIGMAELGTSISYDSQVAKYQSSLMSQQFDNKILEYIQNDRNVKGDDGVSVCKI